MILLDTDTCIELLKGNKRILQRRDQYDGPVGVCFMTIAELYYGAEKSKDPSKNMDTIEKLLITLEIVHTDIAILRRFGMIKAHLQKQGCGFQKLWPLFSRNSGHILYGLFGVVKLEMTGPI
jgi:tRNA(fMet)-specific endonuclease VapC